MNDDELRDRIARLDPARDAATEPITSPSARALLEATMNTPVNQTTEKPGRPRWAPLVGVAAALVAALAIGAAVVNSGDDGGEAAPAVSDTPTTPASDAPTTPPGKLKVLELNAGAEDTMAMCMQISPESVASMPIAFKGTVETAENGIVTLHIDQAYKGTDAQMATLVAPDGMQALIGGIEFEVGGQYLITATDGTINYCGHSGPATADLQAIFDQAFPAG
jgi:hypothetical protein